MKISRIKIQSFLGIRNIDLPLTEFSFFCGANGSGKSSIENAIRLAYTGSLTRINLKKELGALVHEGQKAATIELEGDPGTTEPITISASGKATGIMNPENAPWWAHALCDMRYLSTLEPTALRRCLFNMSGKTGNDEIIKRLKAGGAHHGLLDLVTPLLPNFDAAYAEASSQATQARGQWKGITGETYGEVKAETWKADVPAEPDPIEDNLQALQMAADAVRDEIAELKAAERQRQTVEEALRAARKASDDLTGLENAVQAMARDLGDLKGQITELDAKAAGKSLPDPLGEAACPDCGSVLKIMPGLELMPEWDYAERSKAKPDPKAKAAVEEARKRHKVLNATHAAELNKYNDACREADKVPDLEARLKELVGAPDMAALQQKSMDATAALRGNEDALKLYTDALRARKEAQAKTAQAAVVHESAKAWIALRDLLSPDGVPAQLLDEVLTNMNDRMRLAADRTKWGQVQIHADMRITYGGRSLPLCSESERWRTDLMLTEAVSYITAECLLMADRYDVLHISQRSVLLDWCDQLVREGTQVILFGTLKEKPAASPSPTFYWLEKGVIA